MKSSEFDVRWFAWQEIYQALAYGRAGGIALHFFRYDLRRFGLGACDPCCHVISSDRDGLVEFVAQFGMLEYLIQRPKPQRAGLWHFDAFGEILQRLERANPPPAYVKCRD